MARDLMIHVDSDGALIRVCGQGQVSMTALRDHFVVLDRAMKDMRKRYGGARVLIDLGDTAVQTAEVAAMIQQESRRLFCEQDRVALLCHSMLQTLQVRRSGPGDCQREFSPEREAEAIEWLRAAPPAKDGDPLRVSA